MGPLNNCTTTLRSQTQRLTERLIRKPTRPKKPDEMLRTTKTTNTVKSADYRLQRRVVCNFPSTPFQISHFPGGILHFCCIAQHFPRVLFSAIPFHESYMNLSKIKGDSLPFENFYCRFFLVN